jgi:mRNA deadenylase 3'-5' endonuclease subunit Ccr4
MVGVVFIGDMNCKRDSEAYKFIAQINANKKHQLKLVDAYKDVELPFTMFFEAVKMISDYIFFSNDSLEVSSCYKIVDHGEMLPSVNFPSDHVFLSCDFKFI